MGNFITEDDLNRIKGLLHYMNESFAGGDLDGEVALGDSNGDHVGTVRFEGGAYVFSYGE